MNVHQEVQKLLGDMLDRVSGRVPLPVMEDIERVTDEISTLVMAHTVPAPDAGWDAYGFTPKELRIAQFLHSKLGKIVSHEAIMGALYFDKMGDEPDRDVLKVFMVRVRRKLEGSEFSILTEHGFGWRMIRNH